MRVTAQPSVQGIRAAAVNNGCFGSPDTVWVSGADCPVPIFIIIAESPDITGNDNTNQRKEN